MGATEKLALSVECPKCEAPAGVPCADEVGYHGVRYEMAELKRYKAQHEGSKPLTVKQIKARKKELDHQHTLMSARHGEELARYRIEVQLMQAQCKHKAKYATNCMGRDPGGAYCPTCGKSW